MLNLLQTPIDLTEDSRMGHMGRCYILGQCRCGHQKVARAGLGRDGKPIVEQENDRAENHPERSTVRDASF